MNTTVAPDLEPAARPSGSALSGEHIVCLAHEPWHGPWKTYQQLMLLLARSNRVLYVGPPRSLRDAIAGFANKTRRAPVLERVSDTLAVYHEPWPYARARPASAWTRPFNWSMGRLRLSHVRRLAARDGMRSPILWVFDPAMACAAGTFGEKLLVYYVLDNYVGFFAPEAASQRAATAANEATMLAKADLVFTVSEPLYQRCARENARTFLVPNGVDYEFFQAAVAAGGMPDDLARIPRPIIGHVGAIQPDINFALLERLADDHPEWSLVFVGPEDIGGERPRFEAFRLRRNVHYLGSKPVRDVPLYINGCNVCIMPYRLTDAAVSDCDSIKLYEYLACGRPVVSTDVPSARRFVPLIRIANDIGEFAAHVESALEEAPDWAEARKREASRQSWQRRVLTLSEIIAQRIGEKR